MDETLLAVGSWVLSSVLGGGIVAMAGYALLKDRLIADVIVGDEGYPRLRKKIEEDLAQVFALRTDVAALSESLARERQHREKADDHRDREQRRVSEFVQTIMGRIDGLERRMEEADRGREREVAALREEVRTGFARLEEALKQFTRKGER